MTKIRLIISKDYYNEVLSALHDLGALQIDVTGEEALNYIERGESASYKEISDLAQRFRGLESLMYPISDDKRFTFESMKQLLQECSSVKIDQRVADIRKEMDALAAAIKDDEQKLSLLSKLKTFKKDLSILTTKGRKSFVAEGKELRQFAAALKKEVKETFIVGLEFTAVINISVAHEKEFGAVAERFKVNLEVIPEMHGTPTVLGAELENNLNMLRSRLRAHQDELTTISEKWYTTVSAIREQLDIEMEQQEVTNKIGLGRSIIIMEGWVPQSEMAKLKEVVNKMSRGHFILHIMKTKELAPTKLENPLRIRFFESFIRFYSLPSSNEIDPTMMFVIVFPIFFGFMVGDFGYGLIMLLMSIWIIHRVNHPVKRSRLPKMITGFVTMIVPAGGLRTISKAIIPGAIIAMVLGIIFNEYMGFTLPYTPILNPITQLSTLLVIAGTIGVIMVEFGFALGFINALSHHKMKEAASKAGWFTVALGIVIFGLNVLHKANMGPSNPVAIASYVMLIGGLITVLYGEGTRALMELPSVVSHILSYVRLVGILLTSVILASIIDRIFIHGVTHGILLSIVGIVILVIGQIFNLVVALFESGIQGARLIYVEFFSKFFTGQGVPFSPFKSSRKRTLSRFDLR